MEHVFEQSGNTFCVSFPKVGAFISVARIKELSSGDYRGWVELFAGDVKLHGSVVNLCLASARQTLQRSLNGKAGELPWGDMLDTACNEVIARLQAGSPMVSISSDAPVAPEQFLISPFLPMHEPTILFGRGGSCKSYVGLLLGIAAQLAWRNNPLGWTPPLKPVRVLVLDWETSRDVVHRRVKRLVKGMSLPAVTIDYRECRGSLATEVDAVASLVLQQKIGLVIVDSAGRAVGDDLNAPGPVNAFYAALRQLDVTSLIVHHCAKNELTREKTPFGSQYFEANARSAWFIEREREGSDTDFAVSLTNTKVNDSPKHPVVGLRVHFDNTPGQESTRFEATDLKHTEFADRMPLLEQIEAALLRSSLTPAELAEELGKPTSTISPVLSRHKDRFASLGAGKWGVTANVTK